MEYGRKKVPKSPRNAFLRSIRISSLRKNYSGQRKSKGTFCEKCNPWGLWT